MNPVLKSRPTRVKGISDTVSLFFLKISESLELPHVLFSQKAEKCHYTGT